MKARPLLRFACREQPQGFDGSALPAGNHEAGQIVLAVIVFAERYPRRHPQQVPYRGLAIRIAGELRHIL